MRFLVTGVLLASGVALAQEPVVEGEAAEAAPAEPAPEAAAADPALFAALQLPSLAHTLRAAGVPHEEIAEALEAARGAGLDGAAAADVLRRTVREVRQKGTVQGYGGFVKEQLAAGKRGQELAEAIRQAHAERGKRVVRSPSKAVDLAGRPTGGAESGGGRPAHAGDEPADAGSKPAHAGGKPAGAGEPSGGGKPAQPGKPAEAGKPAHAGGSPAEAGSRRSVDPHAKETP